MSESSWSLVLANSNSYLLDGSSTLEEFLNGPLLSPEPKVSNEDSSDVGITAVALRPVSSSGLSREFNPDGSSIEILLIS